MLGVEGGGSGGKFDYSLGDAGAMWDRVGLPSRMCSARTVRSSRQPASCLTILPPRTECSVVSLTPRGAAFGGRSIRMEFDLNGRRQAAVIMVFPPCVDCTEGLPTPAATWVRAFFGGPARTELSLSHKADSSGSPISRLPSFDRITTWRAALQPRHAHESGNPSRRALSISSGVDL